MSRVLSKILAFSFLLISTFYFLSSVNLTYAASQVTPNQSNVTALSNTNPDVPNNLHNWTQTVMIEVMSSLTCQIAGIDPINPKQSCLGADVKTGKIGFLPSPKTGGAIGFMGNMISVLYTPPLHTSDYFQNLAQNFGITKKTYAAQSEGGTGFQSLSPLMGIWTAFRNIVYLILVIVFVVIGLAIMLRVKIDPRTVMSIQNQIPKIIVGILAVTFSFAIAGFLIDMMWVLIYLIYGVFSGISPEIANIVTNLSPTSIQGKNVIDVVDKLIPVSGGVFGIANNVATSSRALMTNILGISPVPLATFGNLFEALSGLKFQSLGSILPNFLIDLISSGAGLFVGSSWAQLIADKSIFGWSIPTGTAAGIIGGFSAFLGAEEMLRFIIPYGIVFLIVSISLLVALFKLWFALIMAYVQILLSVVLAPFWIIGGIIPGSPISLGGWFKNMAANLLAFPATLAMFMLGKIFMDIFGNTSVVGVQKFTPPFIGDVGDPSLIGSLIGLGIILMTPNIVNLLKTALKAPKTDMGIGAAIGAGTGIPTKAAMTAGGIMTVARYDISGERRATGAVGRILQRLMH